ncbi:sister chromatid cohesion protein pds5-like [Salvia splendens]|uniref:sister chromatid cohesion protein pds5-like n=1 Tax=Salvia splendens TaxID=180675 RepID=UPI001C26EEEA|nr:sister chromatid cohesion protein pds5-like [Salvia splendens]XP_042040800.1 sister chromatid cohesion protein pds5-like [Salvia splendens]XP_042040806.1 sister chromatid cohesion protein pds5-like [Salvia splendens]
MAEVRKKQQAAKQLLKQIGDQLVTGEACPDESVIVKLLKKAASAFMELKQSDSEKYSVNPSGNSRMRQGLLDQRDRDAPVLPPDPAFSHAVSSKIFRFLLRMFEELHDTSSKYFRTRAKILETVDKLQFCLVMLDTGCEDLVVKMFKSFFSVIREDHPQSLIDSVSSIITSILAENVETDPNPLERNTFQPLLDVILRNIIKEKKAASSAPYRLAASVVQNSSEKLKCYVCQFLTSCILDRDAVGSPIKEAYHEIILEIYQVAPELLLSVIPHLTHELLTDQVDVRIKVLNLIKKLLMLQGKNIAREYPCVLAELLNRFSDKSAEVRLTALSSAKALYVTNLSGRDSLETLFNAIGCRLLDHDDKVRMEAVNVVCELAKTNLNHISSDLIAQASERLRDKKVSVRSKAFEKLVELYQEYCSRLAAHITSFNEKIEEIPCKLLMLCYEKDCQEFRPQAMDLVLVDLFPAHLSIEEKTKHWISIFSHFKPPHLRALKTILSQKRRLREGLKHYLDLCRRTEDTGPGETERDIEALVVKMSSCFQFPAKAKDCFQKLKELRDNRLFSVVEEFLKENAVDFDTIKDVYLKELEGQKALSEFFHLLFRKCAYNIIGFEHVHYILDCLSSEDAEEQHLKNYHTQLLLTIIGAFPSLLKGSETKFQQLILEGEIPFNEQLIEILAREGCHMPVKLSDIYPSLEKVSIEGTRSQSKLAVTAICALVDTSEQFIYPQLCKILVDSLQSGKNVPTVLQSLGCLAQYSISTFESQEKVITNYILEKIFQQNDALASKDLETSTCCSVCEFKVYGLKTIVRSFLPHKNACHGRRPFSFLLEIIKQMLQNHQLSAGCIQCGRDEAFIRLAAAKSVLRLSRKWDLHISPEIFRLTVLLAKDPSPIVRRSFTSKLHKLLLCHAVPIRYACALSFVALDPLEDLRCNALKYMEGFIREYGKRVQIRETITKEGAATHSSCLIMFLIHVLAHDRNFPAPDCEDAKIYAEFMSPLFVTMQSLVTGNLVDHNLRSIFSALKKAEDAIDAQMTPKLRLLADVGLSIFDSLNTKITPLGHTHAVVLLPSSLYKNGATNMREANPYSSIFCKANPSFTKNLVSSLKTEVFLIGTTGTKQNHQFTENSLRPSGTRHIKPNPAYSNKEVLLMENTKAQVVELEIEKEQSDTSNCEADTRGQQNLTMPSLLRTVVLDGKTDACKELDATPSDYCDSMSKSSLPGDEFVASCPRNKDLINKTDSIPAEPSGSTASDQVDHVMPKIIESIESNDGGLARKHTKTCTPTEECCFSVIEDSFDSTKSIQQDLDDPLTHNCVQSSSSTANAEAENLDSHAREANLPKKRDLIIRKASQAAKRTKQFHDPIGTASSEVIDSNGNQLRRSRRQKV